MSKFFSNKKFSLLLALSAVVIIAGIILYALLGFNTAPDKNNQYTVEVKYDVIVVIEEQEGDLQTICEDAFKKVGLSYTEKEVLDVLDSNSLTETTERTLVYTFTGNINEAKLAEVAAAINAAVGEGSVFGEEHAIVAASWHKLSGERFYEFAWRGAIAIAVGAIVALIYVCIRYGVSCAVAGLVCAAHDALFTAALFAITRFPVYAATPLLYAAVAAFMSIVLWLTLCGKMKDAFKASAAATSEEVIRGTVASSKKTVLFTAVVFGIAVVVLGAVAAFGTMLYVLPAIVGVFVPVYSTLFIGPDVCIPIRLAFDKRRERAKKKGGYVGKKKADAVDAE